ncbi:MAG: hypothetical protein KC656_16020 [Myxococcales bacterium]|nr:hypothetical protein [Myxococcales bacterium]
MLFLLPFANAEPDPAIPRLDWDWSTPRRYLVETEVRLPLFIWFRAARNRDVRVVGFQLRAVLECEGTDRYDPARKDEVFCRFEDVSLVVGTQPGDRGLASLVVDEYDEVLTGSSMRMMVQDRGHIVDVAMPELAARNSRVRGRNETLRQLVRFLAMGFELPLTDGGDDLWLSHDSLLCTMTTSRGTTSQFEGVTRGAAREGLIELASHGRGLMTAGNDLNSYTCETTARAFYEPDVGPLRHTWEMLGEPTPSSAIAWGTAGYPYTQRGGLRRLKPDEVVDLGVTGEVQMGGAVETALQADDARP